MIKVLSALAATTLLFASPALAQDAPSPAADVRPDDAVIPIESSEQKAARANAEWARRIMAGEKSAEAEDTAAASDKGCIRNPDRAPHGVVWGEVGSGGYKSGGAIVTQPVGDCGSLTIGYEQTHDNRGGGYRRRR